MMNYPGVIAGEEKMLAEMVAMQTAGKVIGGHYVQARSFMPMPLAALRMTMKARKRLMRFTRPNGDAGDATIGLGLV